MSTEKQVNDKKCYWDDCPDPNCTKPHFLMSALEDIDQERYDRAQTSYEDEE